MSVKGDSSRLTASQLKLPLQPRLFATRLGAKLVTLMESLRASFGVEAQFDDPPGGIFLWVKLPDGVDALTIYQPALAADVAINPGPEWSGTRRTPAAACALRASPTRKSTRVSRRWPKCAAASSMCLSPRQ